MHLVNYQFKPKWIPTLAFLILLPILLSLGFWQLDRKQEKETLLGAQTTGQAQVAMSFPAAQPPKPYSKVKVSGQWHPEFSIFLEHQMHDSQPGYHVLTPLAIKPDLPWLWVNRGWVPIKNDYTKREFLEPSLELEGLIYYPSENRFILGENFSKTPKDLLKIQRMDFKALTAYVRHDFYPYVLLLAPDSPQGFIRNWQIKTLPPSQHLGYAVQWFALAGTLVILYIIVNLQRKTKK